jgi:type I restriction enzyme S subunit
VERVVANSKGVSFPAINESEMATYEVASPPLPEQRDIAAFLDRETARIDALVAKKERLVELLQEKRTALITRAVTKGLDPTVPMKDSGVEWLGEIPAHWETKALSRTLLRITYGFTNPMPVADVGPYMLTALDIGDGEILYEGARRTTEEAFARLLTDKSRPTAGDILLTKDGTLGRVAVVGSERACINQSVALLRFDQKVDIGFVQLALRAAPYQERMAFEAGGTAIKHIYISRLARMAIALPEKSEQHAIAAFLDRETARIDALVAKVREVIERLKEYRTALISAAVTGKIDVRHSAQE